jgi:hypothetical protein
LVWRWEGVTKDGWSRSDEADDGAAAAAAAATRREM